MESTNDEQDIIDRAVECCMRFLLKATRSRKLGESWVYVAQTAF